MQSIAEQLNVSSCGGRCMLRARVRATDGPIRLSLPAVRLGIPALHLEDGPQGVGDFSTGVTMWPSALTVAASFDADLVRRWGAAQGREFRGKGMNVMLGPGVNLARVPWNGRNYECKRSRCSRFAGAALL